jgi:outer membrane protein assembly factor BamB
MPKVKWNISFSSTSLSQLRGYVDIESDFALSNDGSVVYFMSSDTRSTNSSEWTESVHAVRTSDGGIVWERNLGHHGSFKDLHVSSDGSTVFAGGTALYAFKSSDGTTVWKSSDGTLGPILSLS